MQPDPAIDPEGTFDGLRPGPIFLGATLDVVFTFITSMLLVAWLNPAFLNASESELPARLSELNANPAYVAGSLVLGVLGTLLGAFVGARRAGRLHVRHGGWIAVTSTALGALILLFEPNVEPQVPFPLWAEVLGWILILPAGLAGGALAGALGNAPPRG